MISVEQALAEVEAAFRPLPAELIGLDAALDRVLAEDLTAGLSNPPDDVSAMDGYAVRAEDIREVPATLRLIGQSAAGAGFPGAVGPGETVRVFTGAPIPTGADTVVIQEDAEQHGGEVVLRETPGARKLHSAQRPGLRKRRRSAARRPATLAPRHRPRGVDERPWVPVRRKPRVAILATGNELLMPGEVIRPDRIISSASFSVAASVRRFGANSIALGIARDDENSLCEMLQRARGVDLLITIGGASVGDFDLVRSALGAAGFAPGFHKVAMQPGKPLIFGRLGQLPVLGLPGNPVSAVVTALLFAKPAIERMLGIAHGTRSDRTARLARDLPANGQRQQYLRATLSRAPGGGLIARPFDSQDSSLQRLLSMADCLVVRPPNAPLARAGARVAIVEFGDDPFRADENTQEALDGTQEPN